MRNNGIVKSSLNEVTKQKIKQLFGIDPDREAFSPFILDAISQSEQERIQYENELIAELDANTRFKKAKIEGLAEGRAEGEKEALIAVARSMKEKGMKLSVIIEVTKLTEDEINKL